MAHEGGSFFDGERSCGDVPNEDGVVLEFATLMDGDVAFDFAENDDRAGFHLALDQRVLTNYEAAVRNDFTFNFTVDDEIMGKLDGTFNCDVVGENVFTVGHEGDEC